MARTLKHYLKSHPAPKRKRGRGVATAEKIVSVGWAWNPDDETRKAISRGNRKVKRAKAKRHLKVTEDSKMATRKGSKKRTAKKTTAKKVANKRANGATPLKKICQQLKLDPKMARRKLRADKAMMKIHTAKGRWEFSAAQAKKAKAVLSA